MTNAQWTVPHDPNNLSLPLNERIAGGRGMWLIGRLLIGGLFLMSGAQKLMGLDQSAAALVKGGIPDNIAPMLAPIAAGAEIVGGLCIVLGLFTSWASLLMIVFTIVAALVSQSLLGIRGRCCPESDGPLHEEHDDRRRLLPAVCLQRRSLLDRSLVARPQLTIVRPARLRATRPARHRRTSSQARACRPA